MRILHYTLGFPPARSGGLVGYAIDVMNEQINQGNEVYALFPGGLNFINRKMQIKSGSFSNIKTFELINSLPLPIFGGIKTPADFMVPTSKMLFINLLKKIKPDVIHIHTLMGIPKEFFSAAKSEGITIVFTSHDYFGLAPDPSFYYNKKSYDQDNTDAYWKKASENAYSTKKLRIFQLKFYPVIRKLIKKIKTISSKKQERFQKNSNFNDNNDIPDSEYKLLRNYYKDIFSLIDKYHFNSTVAKKVYENNLEELPKKEYKIISITNKDIYTHQKVLFKTESKKIRIAYVGPNEYFKGFYEFIKLSKLLDAEKYEFHTYGYNVASSIEGIVQHGKYNRNQIANIYRNIDVLVVPSKWKETFGLVALEGKAYQTPVFISNNVGSKDLFESANRFNMIEELTEKIEKYTYLKQGKHVKNITEHVEELLSFYV